MIFLLLMMGIMIFSKIRLYWLDWIVFVVFMLLVNLFILWFFCSVYWNNFWFIVLLFMMRILVISF